VVIDKKYSKRHKKELWGFDGRINGKRIRDRRFHTKKEAEEAWATLVSNQVADEYGWQSKQRTTLRMAVDAYKDKYLQKAENKDKDYRQNLETHFRVFERFVEFMGGDNTLVRKVDEKALLDWGSSMKKSPQTLASYARRLLGVLSLAKERFQDLHSWQPPKMIEYTSNIGNTRERIITRDEAQKLVHALLTTERKNKEAQAHMRDAADIFRIALVTGMRAKEVFRLGFGALREKSNQIFVGLAGDGSKAIRTKTGYSRIIPLPPIVVEIVNQRKRDGLTDGLNIFPRFFSESAYYYNIRRALIVGTQAAKLDYGRDGDGFTLHDARATYITNILRGDLSRGIPPVSIGTAMKLSGHRTLSAFQKYVRMVEEDVVNAVAMSQSLAELHMAGPMQNKEVA
jgi:integrase